MQLSTISHLDISGCALGAEGGFHLAGVIKNMGAMTSLDVSSNNLGSIVGWAYHSDESRQYKHTHSDGRYQELLPEGEELGKPEGIIALATAISDMRALLSLNISDNDLCGIHVYPNGYRSGTYNAAGNSDSIDLNITYSYVVQVLLLLPMPCPI
jgi:hypothetical protein